jgi:predicted nucleic acid-binding protein
VSGVFLDSNVILCLLSADAAKADTAETLLMHQPTISVQVLNEVTSVCHQLSFYDAHIISAAIFSGAHRLMSEYMQHGVTIQGIQIHNPLTQPNL